MAAEIKRKRRRKKNRKFKIERSQIVLVLIAIAALAVIIGVQIFLRVTVKDQPQDEILQGVTIGGTDVSGMTVKEAKSAVEAAVEKESETSVTLVTEDGDTAKMLWSELDLTVKDMDGTVQKALDYGKKGSLAECYKILKKAKKGELDQNFPLSYKMDEKLAETVLTDKLKDKLDLPVNADLQVTDDGVKIVEEKAGEVVDMEATTKAIQSYLEDWDGKEGKVTVTIKNTEPDVTKEDLEEVPDLLGSYTTYYGNDGSGRATNVESGAKHVGGKFLEPGEEMSADDAMRPYTEENGFALAASYESNTVVETMGGGICQVSTTLYNALLYAELEITERYPHSMLVSYVEASRDAAIADDILDLSFKNNQKTPVYIQAILEDGSLTFNIYGKETRDPGRTLEFISETTESKETEGRRYVATEDYIGYIGFQSSAHPEIHAQLWKVVYQDGEEVSREIINYSQYVAAPETYGVGTYSDNPEYTNLMNSAILSQDESQIQSVIDYINSGGSSAETDTTSYGSSEGVTE